MVNNYDKDWLIKLSQPDSVFNKQNTIYAFTSSVEVRKKLERENNLTNDQMCQSQNLGFWCLLFQTKQYRDINVQLSKIFVNAPTKGKVHEEVHMILNQVRKERNKLAHHEPVIFMRHRAKISFYKTELIIKQVMIITRWLGVSIQVFDDHLALINEQKQAIKNLVFGKI
jgi:hypothetical protein